MIKITSVYSPCSKIKPTFAGELYDPAQRLCCDELLYDKKNKLCCGSKLHRVITHQGTCCGGELHNNSQGQGSLLLDILIIHHHPNKYFM